MERLNDVRANWGKREYFVRLLAERAPDAANDPTFREWFVTHMRRSLIPGAAAAYFRTAMDADISDVLPAVRVPTLILFSPARRGPAEFFAGRIPMFASWPPCSSRTSSIRPRSRQSSVTADGPTSCGAITR